MVVHKGEKRRTVVQQIANMWDNYGRKGVHLVNAMQVAFDVEPVTRAFFADYKRVFDNANVRSLGSRTTIGGICSRKRCSNG